MCQDICRPRFQLGYDACIREEAIDRMLDGNSLSSISRDMKITYSTLRKWLSEFRQAGKEIDAAVARQARAPQIHAPQHEPRTLYNLTRSIHTQAQW